MINTTNIPETEYSSDFINGMLRRMGVSYHKYGPVAAANGVDAVNSALRRISKYQATGNTEWLMDAANFLMMEFMNPSLDYAHFRATDSDESPGRVFQDGDVSSIRRNR